MRLSYALVLLVLTSLGAAGCGRKKPPVANGEGYEQPIPRSSEDQVFLQAWADSGFTYCDAEMLADHWSTGIEDAKVRVGMKLKGGMGLFLVNSEVVEPARQAAASAGTAKCDFFANGFTTDDAEALASLWGVDLSEAKLRVESKLAWGDVAIVRDMLASAHGDESGEHDMNPEDEYLEYFWNGPFTYCDAELLAKSWSISVWEGKVSLGAKLANGWSQDEIVRDALGPAFEGADLDGRLCRFFESDYTWEDAELLSGLWLISVDETKAAISRKLMSGYRDDLDEELTRARDLKR